MSGMELCVDGLSDALTACCAGRSIKRSRSCSSASRCSEVSSGRIGMFFPAAHIDCGDTNVHDARPLVAWAGEHGERTPVKGVSEDEISLEVAKGHLETGRPCGLDGAMAIFVDLQSGQ